MEFSVKIVKHYNNKIFEWEKTLPKDPFVDGLKEGVFIKNI